MADKQGERDIQGHLDRLLLLTARCLNLSYCARRGGFDLSKEDTKQTAHTKTKCEQLPRLAIIEFAVFLPKKKTSRNSSSLLVKLNKIRLSLADKKCIHHLLMISGINRKITQRNRADCDREL